MTNIIIPKTYVKQDSFKRGVIKILEKHLAPEIVSRFRLDLEANIYNTNSPHIWQQRKDEKFILEVRYQTGQDTWEYICDVNTEQKPDYVEYWLLKNITDKYKEGKIYFDSLRVNKIIEEGKFETIDPELPVTIKKGGKNEKRNK